jgi:diguanylate cyclase (GGDEF)-like protein/PAS domain S-box-containing protein
MTLGLGTRLALIISFVLFFLMISAGIVVDRQLTRAIDEEGLEQAAAHAQTMLATLQTLMLSGQATQVRDWMQRMHNHQDVVDINILRVDGSEAFTDTSTINAVNEFLGHKRFSREPLAPLQPQAPIDRFFTRALRGETGFSRSDSGYFTFYLPIIAQEACLGCHGYDTSGRRGVMKLIQSTADVDKRIKKMRQRLWDIAIVLVLVLGSLMWALLRFYVLRPVLHLQDAIIKVGDGDRQARLKIERNDELGAVSQVFNRMQIQLQASEARIRAVTDNVADGIIIINTQGLIESANPAVTTIFGYPQNELVGQNVAMLMPSPYQEHHDEYIRLYKETGQSRLMGSRRELVGMHKDGREIPIDITLSKMVDNNVRYFIGIIRDITERKQQMMALKHQALHDNLTGLPNRNLLIDRVEQALRTGQRQNRPMALLIVDLDRFKEINDTLGHINGDLVLKQVAEHLREVVRSSDTVARLGGDEFAILLPTAEVAHAIKVCRKLLGRLEETIQLQGHSFVMGASIGIALYPDHGSDEVTLMQCADVAMYAAKRAHSGFMVYDPTQNQHSLQTLSLIGELRIALEEGQLRLYYQPVIDLQTHIISGVEALVRWQHPRLGLLQPDDFISVAEQTGLIRQLTSWVLETAAEQTRQWSRQGLELRIAVNLSAHNLHDLSFTDKFLDLLDQDTTKMPRLRLEITESAIMSGSTHALEVLNRLSARGVHISIDDFGTGYSSLNYLKRLPVDEIKIDRSFVTHMTVDENDAVIVRSTIDLAHNMGFKVVAEGVEDEATYQLLERLHCDLVQGFYISAPLPDEELVQWLQNSRWRMPEGQPRP